MVGDSVARATAGDEIGLQASFSFGSESDLVLRVMHDDFDPSSIDDWIKQKKSEQSVAEDTDKQRL